MTDQNPQQPYLADPNVNYFGLTNFRNQYRKFGIKLDDRLRHVYVVGKSGMGKSTLLENMVLNDIYAGHGVGLVDPHGDFAEKVVDCIPAHRVKDVVYFNPCDLEFPVGFNILEAVDPNRRHLIADGLRGVFKKIWPDVWSARMEYILVNTILALLEYPGTTLLSINRLLADDEYRDKVVAEVKDPAVKAFWEKEFANYNDKYKQEAVAPIQNKIGQFLAASIIRNIVAQPKSTINIREIMDSKKIFIVNLSKGRVGEDNSRLLGAMLVTKLYLSAMERVDIKAKDRKPFFLYVDEFQNFATESFASILSEARKYGLSLTVAHQYMKQLDEMVLDAIIGNVGTMISFRVGSGDSEILAKEFIPTFTEEDLINLPKFQIYLKLLIDGVASRPFSAMTLPPVVAATDNTPAVIAYAHEHYTSKRADIEREVAELSGIVTLDPNVAQALEVSEEESVYAAPPARTAPPRRDGGGGGGKRFDDRRDGGNRGGGSYGGDRGGGRNRQGGNGGGQFGGGQRRDGGGRSDGRRDRGDRDYSAPRPPAPHETEQVLLVDPNQKGLSLNAIASQRTGAEQRSDRPRHRDRDHRGQQGGSERLPRDHQMPQSQHASASSAPQPSVNPEPRPVPPAPAPVTPLAPPAPPAAPPQAPPANPPASQP